MDKLRAAYRVAVIMGLAMMGSLLIYLVIVALTQEGIIKFQGPEMTGRPLELMRFVLLGASGVLFFLARILPGRILGAGEPDRGTPRLPAQQSGAAPTEIQRLTTAAVVSFALCEVPAVFGLVLFFLGRNSSDFHLFLLISLFYFAIYFPKFSQWEAWYRKQQGR